MITSISRLDCIIRKKITTHNMTLLLRVSILRHRIFQHLRKLGITQYKGIAQMHSF